VGVHLEAAPGVFESRLHTFLAGSNRRALIVDGMEESMASGPGPQGSLIMLWAGEDPALHSSLLEELEAAGIPFIDKPTGDDEVAPTADTLPIDWKARFGFEVAVLSSNLPVAEKILERLLDEDPVDMEISANDSGEASAAEVKPSLVGATTSAVWSGSDEARAGFLSQALKENEIPVRVEMHGSETTLYVPPEEEMLAREIIREIVEGAPPA
jgi:hypothetical protein